METFKFTCRNGTIVDIEIDDFSYMIEVFAPGRKKIGGMDFRHIQDEHNEVLLLSWAYLDEAGSAFVGQGIGRQCLKRMIEVSGMPITARDHDGMRREDGSHLTGDAPAFVERMRKEGWITD